MKITEIENDMIFDDEFDILLTLIKIATNKEYMNSDFYLTPIEYKILVLSFGFKGFNYTAKEISAKLKISINTVYLKKQNALNKLKNLALILSKQNANFKNKISNQYSFHLG